MSKNSIKLNKAAEIIAKIAEVFHWVGAAISAAGLIAYLFNEKLIKYFMNLGSGELSFAGYSIGVFDKSGNIVKGVFIPTLILLVIALGLTAMIFRNIYLIFKTAEGKTRFSKGATPFQQDNVRMLREIGIFAIAIPVTEYIFDIVIKIIAANDTVESSLSVTGFVFGIALLCLSQFFAYGVQLQNDNDGLL